MHWLDLQYDELLQLYGDSAVGESVHATKDVSDNRTKQSVERY